MIRDEEGGGAGRLMGEEEVFCRSSNSKDKFLVESWLKKLENQRLDDHDDENDDDGKPMSRSAEGNLQVMRS